MQKKGNKVIVSSEDRLRQTGKSIQKNVLAVHDISCVGKCSLTVAVPIISHFGVECRVLPTALLSTHTGGFTDFTNLDLTSEMKKILSAWRPLELQFDAIYSGFMANSAQIDLLKTLIKTYPTLTIIDPVMADNGSLYSVFNEDYVTKMRELVPLADVLTPNVTEACLLTGIPYQDRHSKYFVDGLVSALKDMGAKSFVLTGILNEKNQIGALSYREGSGESESIFYERLPGIFHGTGDIFGSVLTAQLVKGTSLQVAMRDAVRFVVESIEATPDGADLRYGVNFEFVLTKW